MIEPTFEPGTHTAREPGDERLEDRLARLAQLHDAGHLDDAEYRAAKALILAPRPAGPRADPVTAGFPTGTLIGTSTGANGAGRTATTPTVRTIGRLPWWGWLLIAVVLGFAIACLGAVFTGLQGPAGPVLCRNGTFVAGSTSERFADGTTYDIDSACLGGNGSAEHLSGLAITGVLWAEYTLALLVIIAVLVWVIRGLRGPPRLDDTIG
ncbi:MAG: hypothetical protein JWM12_1086 [Ilumatobacteraceae bacterium]|nr:hypothetical protein [Ilumatobacteraceae bacterium]